MEIRCVQLATPNDYSHQKCYWNIDPLNGNFKGKVEMTVTLTGRTRTIYLNARQMKIHKVLVNSVPVGYQYDDPLDPLFPEMESRRTVHNHPGYRKQYLDTLQNVSDGELAIEVPEQFVTQKEDSSDEMVIDGPDQPLVEELTLTIFYSVNQSSNPAIHWNRPRKDQLNSPFPVMYAFGTCGFGRLWIPGLDSLRDKITWELFVITPLQLKHCLPSDIVDNYSLEELEQDITAVCSGDLEQQYILSDGRHKLFKYKVKTPISSSSISLAVGPFEVSRIPGWGGKFSSEPKSSGNVPDDQDYISDEENAESDMELQLETAANVAGGGYLFTLPGYMDDALHTIGPLTHLMEKIENYVGVSFPFHSFKILSLDSLYNPLVVGAGVTFISSHMLVPSDVIDQIFESRRLILSSVASQWTIGYLHSKISLDNWIIVGLIGFLTSLAFKEAFGNNETCYRMRMDIEKLNEMDINQPPLYPDVQLNPKKKRFQSSSSEIRSKEGSSDPFLAQSYHPTDEYESARSQFVAIKSHLVFHMLNKRMGKGNLQKTINKLMLAAMAGELASGLSTNKFLKTAKKVSGKSDLSMFADQWVYGSGIPKLFLSYAFNRRKMVVEVRFYQTNHSNFEVNQTKIFTGPLVIRVHEPTGTFDTEVMVEDIEKTFEIPYHTKYKSFKKRKPRKKKSKAGGFSSIASTDIEEMQAVENEEDDYEDGLEAMSIEWIRIDPENEWACVKVFEQADFMWSAQLEKDKDVIAQIEAVDALSKLPSDTSLATLVEVVNEEKYFHRIRSQAILGLAKCAIEKLEWIGMNKLLLLYQETYCHAFENNNFIPKTNQFASLQQYFVQKSFFSAFSSIKKHDSATPIEVRRFLLDLLKHNENTGNQYSDNYFKAELIEAIGNSFLKPVSKPVSIVEKPTITLFRQPDSPRFTAMDSTNEPLIEEFDFYTDAPSDLNDQIDHNLFDNMLDYDLFKESLAEIDRRRKLDALAPSYHNSVTLACLNVSLKWMMAGLLPIDISLFLWHSKYGHFQYVRLMAIDALLMLDCFFYQPVLEYLVSLIEHDPDPFFRYYVAKALHNYSALASTRSEEDAAARLYGKFDDMRKLVSSWDKTKDKIWQVMNKSAEKRIQLFLLRFSEIMFDSVNDPADMTLKLKVSKITRITIDDSSSEDEEPSSTLQTKHRGSLLKDPNSLISKHKRKPLPIVDVNPQVVPAVVKVMIDELRNNPNSTYFIHPVDESFAPGYFTLIKTPMDLTKIQSKNNKLEYGDAFSFAIADVEQIFENCFTYNEDISIVSEAALKLEQFFEQDFLPRVPQISQQETIKHEKQSEAKEQQRLLNLKKQVAQTCISIWRKLNGLPASFWFRLPVDPVAAGVPHYYDVVKNPMDLSKIKSNIDKLLYSRVDQFHSDVQLMLSNAMSFNALDTQVYKDALIVLQFYQEMHSTHTSPTQSTRLIQTDTNSSVPPQSLNLNLDRPVSSPHVPSTPFALTDYTKQSNPQLPSNCSLKSLDQTVSLKESTSDPAKKCSRILKKLQTHKSATIFLNPVDPVALGIPNYFEIIHNPMDLSTIQNKLESGIYSGNTSLEFKDDVTLMLDNCFKFNANGTWPFVQAQVVQTFFTKLWDEQFGVSSATLEPCNGQDAMQKVLQRLIVHPHAAIFLLPVDRKLYPDYYQKIKDPIDLSTIQTKLDAGAYVDTASFESDLKLIISNCFAYNAKKTVGYGAGLSFEKAIKKELKATFKVSAGSGKKEAPIKLVISSKSAASSSSTLNLKKSTNNSQQKTDGVFKLKLKF